MVSVLIQTLLLSLSGLLSVGSITLVILLLISEKGRLNGIGYAAGYTGAYMLIGTAAVILGYRSVQKGNNATTRIVSVLLLILGTLLVGIAFRNLLKPPSKNKGTPRFFSILDSFTPLKALGFGAMVSVINFKNLALFLTALSTVVISTLALPQKIIITLLAAVVFCFSVIVPVSIYLIFPNSANTMLKGLKNSLQRHSHAISIAVPAAFGLIFIIKGMTELL